MLSAPSPVASAVKWHSVTPFHLLIPSSLFRYGRTQTPTQAANHRSPLARRNHPEDIVDSEPLFGEGLGLDSIDALELIVLMEKNYGIRLNNPAEGKAIFASLDTMADYIAQHRTK